MDTGPYVAGMQRAGVATSRAAAAINREVGLSQRTVNAFTKSAGDRSYRPYALIAAGRGFETAADRANLLRGSLLSVTAVAGGFAAALGTNLLSRYADAAINVANQIKTVTTSAADAATITAELSAVADRSRSSFQATVQLYARTARASEHLGLSQEKLLKITETVQKAFSIGGATAAEAQGAALQLSQGIASDRFSGDEFRSVAENAPVLLRGIAESLGVTIGKLREMAHAGELTADVITTAILGAGARIEKEFGETTTTIDRAIVHVDNKLLEFIGNADKAYGLSRLMAQGITAFADNLDKIIPTLTTVAALVGTIFLSKNKGALGGIAGGLAGAALGGSLGGAPGAIVGGLAGGFAGFSLNKNDSIFKQIKEQGAEARAQVVSLTEAQANLRRELAASRKDALSSRMTAQSARNTPAQFMSFASGASISEYERAIHQVNEVEKQRLALADQLRGSYSKLAAVTGPMSAMATRLAENQVKAETKLSGLLSARATIQTRLNGILTQQNDILAQAAVEGRTAVIPADLVKARIASENELLAANAKVGKQRENIAAREAQIANQVAASEQKAVQQRIAISRALNTQIVQASALEDEYTKKVIAAEAARSNAVRSGAAVVNQNVAAATTVVAANVQALDEATGAQLAAARAATPLGRAFAFLRGQGSALLGVLGGPWGIAITGAIVVLGLLGAKAQEEAQKVAKARGIISEELAKLAENEPSPDNSKNLAEEKAQKIAEDIEAVQARVTEARAAVDQAIASNGKVQGIFGLESSPIAEAATALAVLSKDITDNGKSMADYDAGVKALIATTQNPFIQQFAEEFRAATHDIQGGVPALAALNEQMRIQQATAQAYASNPYYAQIIAEAAAIDKKRVATSELFTEMDRVAGRSDEEVRLDETVAKITAAIKTMNEEKGTSVALTEQETVERAKQIIAIEDIAAAEKENAAQRLKSAEEFSKFYQDIAALQAEINSRPTQLVDVNAKAEVKGLVDAFIAGNIQVDELNRRLNGIAQTNISAGMADLIARIQQALPIMAQLLGMFLQMPGSIGGGQVSASDKTRSFGAAAGVTSRDTTQQLHDAGLTSDQKAHETLVDSLMKGPVGGTTRTRKEAEDLAKTMDGYTASVKASEEAQKGAGKAGEKYAEGMAKLRQQVADANLDPFTQSVVEAARGMGVANPEIDKFIAAVGSGNLDAAPQKIKAIADAMREIAAIKLEKDILFQRSQLFLSDSDQNIQSTLRDAGIDINSVQGRMLAGQMAFNDSLKEARDIAQGFAQDFVGALKDGKTFWEALGTAGANALDKIAAKALDMAVNGLFDMIFGALAGGLTGSVGSGVGSAMGNIGSGASGSGWHFAGGGPVDGPGSSMSDSIAAMLSKGEFVVNAASTRQFYPLLKAINDNDVPGFAKGGLVPTMPATPNYGAMSSSTGGGRGGGGLTVVNHIDARGAQMGVAEQIEQRLNHFARNELPARVKNINKDPRAVGGRR